jgi:hypothetical protein
LNAISRWEFLATRRSFGDSCLDAELRMWAFYLFTIGFVAVVLFSIVDRFDQEQRYKLVFKFLIVCTAGAAIVSHLLP